MMRIFSHQRILLQNWCIPNVSSHIRHDLLAHSLTASDTHTHPQLNYKYIQSIIAHIPHMNINIANYQLQIIHYINKMTICNMHTYSTPT